MARRRELCLLLVLASPRPSRAPKQPYGLLTYSDTLSEEGLHGLLLGRAWALVISQDHVVDHDAAAHSLKGLEDADALDGHDYVVLQAIDAHGATVPTRADLEAGRFSDEVPVFIRSTRLSVDLKKRARAASLREVVRQDLSNARAQFAEVLVSRHRKEKRRRRTRPKQEL